ncbi:MAG TPA: hypothetical protein QGF58_22970 [Myxococcota bacterium]|nr:hypothetical protein [Myxococcota bacterium]
MIGSLTLLMVACGSYPEQRSDLHGKWSPAGPGQWPSNTAWFFGQAEFEVEPDFVGEASEVEDGPYFWSFSWTGTYEVDGRNVTIEMLDNMGYTEPVEGTAKNRVLEWIPTERLVLELDPDVFTGTTIELTYAEQYDW